MRTIMIGFTLGAIFLLFGHGEAAHADFAGSGTVSGVFSHTAPVMDPETYIVPAPQYFANYEIPPVPLPGPTASGAGTNSYQWGSALRSGRYFLGGQVVTLDEFFAVPTAVRDAIGEVELLPSTNRLTFTGMPFSSQPKGETFVLGTLHFTNGNSATGTDVLSTRLTISTSSSDPDFTGILDLVIAIETTLNVYDDDGNVVDIPSADIIYFPDFPQFGRFHVFENASTSIELLGEFNSLHFAGFGAVADPSVGYVSPVPESSSLVMLLTAAASLGLLRFRKRLRPQPDE